MSIHIDVKVSLACNTCEGLVDLDNCHTLSSRFDRLNSNVTKLYCSWPCIRDDAERQSPRVGDVDAQLGIFAPDQRMAAGVRHLEGG